MDEQAAKGNHIANHSAATKPSHDQMEKTADAISQQDSRPKVSAKENWLAAEAQLQHAGSGHAEHSEHREHEGHGDHHADMAAVFRKRFWIALVLTLPIRLLSPLLQTLVGLREIIRFPGDAYAEALFRTAKYRPEFPARGFESIDQARLWGSDFVRWYNTEHRHSGIRYVTPEQRHADDDEPLLAARHLLYQAARAKNPARWIRQTRNWSPIAAVTLNPERDGVVAAVTSTSKSMPLAA